MYFVFPLVTPTISNIRRALSLKALLRFSYGHQNDYFSAGILRASIYFFFKKEEAALDFSKTKKAAGVKLRIKGMSKSYKTPTQHPFFQGIALKYLHDFRSNAKDKERTEKNQLTKQNWTKIKRALMLYAQDGEPIKKNGTEKKVRTVCIRLFKAFFSDEN